LKTEDIIAYAESGENIAEHLSNEMLDDIGSTVVKECVLDETARKPWEERNKGAFDLALQVMEQKSYPWEKASNIKFPLLTIAALQFHSRAYPALITSGDLVKCKSHGKDPNGSKRDRAIRVGKHLSYQFMEQDEDWEEEMDRLLISLPIIGSAFKKTYFDSDKGHNVSCNVLANDLIVPYYTKSLKTTPRITQRLTYTPNEVNEKQAEGVWLDIDMGIAAVTPNPLDVAKQEAQGVTQQTDDDQPFEVLEQHRWLDLDDDGIKEPYIVTVNRSNMKVVRLVARFDPENLKVKGRVIYKFEPDHYFTKYCFIPSPDGGFYDLGFGVLLGPINRSINTIMNLLIDGGHLHTLQAGFLGRGARMKSGQAPFRPGEWRKTAASGDDLRKNIIPLPTKEPSTVLFSLLGMLINYGERLGSSTDMMVGENPGQNQKAQTSQLVVEQGMKMFNGVFKRVYRSMREEFRKAYYLNRLYLDNEEYFEYLDSEDNKIYADDYAGDAKDISPAADPNVSSMTQKLQQAQLLIERSQAYPGYKRHEVEKFLLSAVQVPDPDTFLMQEEEIPPQEDPKMKVEQAKLQLKATTDQANVKLKESEFGLKKMKQMVELNKMEAETMKLLAEAESIEAGDQIKEYQLQLDEMRAKREGLRDLISATEEMRNGEGNVRTMEERPDDAGSMESDSAQTQTPAT